jgi:hypothetical protein
MMWPNDIPITPEAARYADTMVGPRGERLTTDNTYEWDALARAYSQGQVPPWVPVGQRLPEPDTRVLVTNGKDVMEARYGHMSRDKRTRRAFWTIGRLPGILIGSLVDTTHWMPLPTTPTK